MSPCRVSLEDALKQLNGGTEKFSYGGRNSETADMNMLSKAKQMEKNGEYSEAIRKETGWFRGYDGKWRYEIDNSGIKTENAEKNYLLEAWHNLSR